MKTTVDIKARTFGVNDRAYRLFPGIGYRHYSAMKENSVIFLDYPGLPAPSENGYPRNEASKDAIIRGERRAQIVYRAVDHAQARMAEIAVEDLSRTRWSPRRELSLAWLNGLYHTAKIGDLVIVPASIRNSFAEDGDRTLVGEIVSEPFRWSEVASEKYRLAGLLVRRVKWLAEIDERELDFRTARSLRTQNALVSLNAASLRPVLGAAYKNVVVEGDFLARFTTQGAEFDARESYHFQAFILAVAEAYRRHKDGGAQFSKSIYAVAAEVKRGDPNIPEQDVSIHSPGYTTIKSTRQVVFVISALFAVALASPASAFDSLGNPDLNVVNSESADYDPCEPKGLDESVRGTLEIMGLQAWKEACSAAQAANEDEGFVPKSTVQ